MTEQALADQANQEGKPADQGGTQQQEQVRDFDAEARDMGWVPESDFKGPKEKWKPAQQFVEDGERILPIVRSQNKKLQAELEQQKADFAKRTDRLEKMTAKTVERLQAQHKAELEQIQTAKLKAVEDGDTAEYKKLDKQEKALAEVKFDEPETKPAATAETTVEEWANKNTWYRDDFDKHDEATRYSQFLAKKNPSITLKDNLAQVEAHMKEKYPELSGKKPAGNGHAAVDGGGEFPGAGKKEGPGSKLPAEARAQAESDVKAGLYKNVDAWAKVYFS
jgi:hypothetical protein